MRRFLRIMFASVAARIRERDAVELALLPAAIAERAVFDKARIAVRRARYPRGTSKLARRITRKAALGRAGAF